MTWEDEPIRHRMSSKGIKTTAKAIPDRAKVHYDALHDYYVDFDTDVFRFLNEEQEEIFKIIEDVYDDLTLGECGDINSAIARFLEKKFDVDVDLVEGIVNLESEDPIEGSDEVYHQWIEVGNENYNIYDFARAVFRTEDGKVNSILSYEKPYFADVKKWEETEKGMELRKKLEKRYL